MEQPVALPNNNLSGQRIGKYSLVRRLAVGGMAELYLARQTGPQGFEKIVVLKRILPHLAGNADFVEMFLHEARLAASLEHPNIVHVSDFGRAGDDHFFVMAYVHGKDVLNLLRTAYARSEALPLPHAITITTGITAGLHYAHEHLGFDGRPLGIVHRDISPANVLVTYDGYVKVVDFGIAKAAAQTTVTQAGVIKGKAAYMSPEQCRARPVDRRSDLFSIGVVLWEMTTMRRLFQGENELALMNQIVYEDARRPSTVVPQYPPALEAIVMKCLQREPAHRYQTAEQLQVDLEGFARDYGLTCSSRDLAHYLQGLFPTEAKAMPGLSGPQPAAATNIPTRAVPSTPTRAESTPGPVPVTVDIPAVASTAPAPAFAPASSPTPGPQTAPAASAWASVPPAGGDFERPPITRFHQDARPRPTRTSWVLGGAIAGTLVGVGGFVGWRQFSPPPEPAASETTSEAAESSTTPPPVAAPNTEEVEAMLALVNQPDQTLALDYPRRHQILDQLRALPGVTPRIDERINNALDLLQAGQAPDPCGRFAHALGQIERNPEPAYAEAVMAAAAPNDSEACAGLETRRQALARILGEPR